MRKNFIFCALALTAAIGCSNAKPSQAELIEDYRTQSEAIVSDFEINMAAIQEDANLSDEEKTAKMDECYESVENTYIDLAVNTIKKHGKDSVALIALADVYNMMEPEQLERLIDGISEELKSDELVQNITRVIASQKSTREGNMFVDFTIEQYPENEDKGVVKFSDYVGKGKYILVDFWASWCGPCKAEIPNIKHVYETYAGDKFDVLSIAVWDDPKDTEKAAYEHGVVWNQIVNAQKIPTELYGIEGIPHIMLIGPDGTIVKRNLRGGAIEETVKAALGL